MNLGISKTRTPSPQRIRCKGHQSVGGMQATWGCSAAFLPASARGVPLTGLDAASLRSVGRSRASLTPPPEKDRQRSRRSALLPGRKAAMARSYGRIATVGRLALRQRRKARGDARPGRQYAFPGTDGGRRCSHGARRGEVFPGLGAVGPAVRGRRQRCGSGGGGARWRVRPR